MVRRVGAGLVLVLAMLVEAGERARRWWRSRYPERRFAVSEGTVWCRDCEWELTGPDHALPRAIAAHVAEVHS